jgi:hypothetical protein
MHLVYCMTINQNILSSHGPPIKGKGTRWFSFRYCKTHWLLGWEYIKLFCGHSSTMGCIQILYVHLESWINVTYAAIIPHMHGYLYMREYVYFNIWKEKQDPKNLSLFVTKYHQNFIMWKGAYQLSWSFRNRHGVKKWSSGVNDTAGSFTKTIMASHSL